MSTTLGVASAATAATSWVAIVGSGVFHGVNPAMGWLFATALGLQRGSRQALWAALPPLALGHAVSVFAVTSSALAFGVLARTLHMQLALGAMLIAWGIYHHLYGHRHRIAVGMTAGFAGLALWSAATATLHGAGLMLVPALMPLCTSGAFGPPGGPLGPAAAATLLHTAVATATSAILAFVAYQYVGLGVLRRGWINFDWLWSAALVAAGTFLLAFG
jgi:hypothetical protein